MLRSLKFIAAGLLIGQLVCWQAAVDYRAEHPKHLTTLQEQGLYPH